MSWALLLATLVAAEPEAEPQAPDAGEVVLQAVRTATPPVLDGKLEEGAWGDAPTFEAFRQSYPTPGAEPSERTELKVLFDDEALYVGVRCFDKEPSAIVDAKGRRDAMPISDRVEVSVDALGDRRSAWRFEVNAGGSVSDGRIRNDTVFTREWDGTWSVAVHRHDTGYDVELAIPLAQLEYTEGSLTGWGFHVRREVARTHELMETVPIARSENALVSRFARLVGLESLTRAVAVNLVPFATGRLVTDGQSLLPTADVGGEVRVQLGSSWSLVASLNPDFGDAEVDDLVLNLANVEYFFPEKRPFFTDGFDALQPLPGAEDQSVFYTRRIGLGVGTPILGAVRLNGGLGESVRVTMLNVLVAGEVDPSKARALEAGEDPDAAPRDGAVRFNPWRPLHLGPSWGLPAQVPPPTNLFAFGVRSRLVPGVFAGVQATLKNALTDACRPGVAAESPECPPHDAQVAALTLDARTPGGDWGVLAQAGLSQLTGPSPRGRFLEEQVELPKSTPGWGAFVRAGKLGGTTWRAAAQYAETSPRFDLNDVGYQAYRNERVVNVWPELRKDTPFGPFLNASASFKAEVRWTADGTHRPKGELFAIITKAEFTNFTQAECTFVVETNRRDQREIRGASVLFERPSYGSATCRASTDTARAVSAVMEAGVEQTFSSTPVPETFGGGGLLELTVRPSPSFTTVASAYLEARRDGPRWLGTENGATQVALLSPDILTLYLAQTIAFTPGLTLQLSGQLLTGRGRYGARFESAVQDGQTVRFVDLTPVAPGAEHDFHQAQLRLSAILRWEIRPGSVASLVYRRDQFGERVGGEAPGLFEPLLWQSSFLDTFLLKLVWTL